MAQDLTVTEALRRLAPTAATPERAYAAVFREIAELLLGRTTVRVAGRPHRFTELELYWHGPGHEDPFTHGDPMQRQLGAWYFHRAGGSYRGGTYKGLDLAFGNAGASGGILVRGLERVEERAGVLIDGPCLVVDHILALTGSPTIEELVRRGAVSIESPDRRSPLHVELDADPGLVRPILATARIGLTLRKGATEARRRYLARPYRFLSEPARIRKGRPHLIVALHQQGRSPDEIAAVTGARRAVIEGHVAAFEAGRARRIAGPDGDGSTDELCRLLGACAVADP